MNKLIIVLLILFSFSNCQKYRIKREDRLRQEGKIHCGWYGKKTIAECRKMYPFNEAANIVLISFPDYEIWEYDVRTVIDSVTTLEGKKIERRRTLIGKEIPVKITRPILETLNVFDRVYSVYEKLELNDLQIDSLSNLCENYTTNIQLISHYRSVTCCYKPRNAIVFFDKKNKPFLNFEICFECGQFRCYAPDNLGYLSNIDECGELYGLFQDFFRKNGIHYGIDSLNVDKK